MKGINLNAIIPLKVVFIVANHLLEGFRGPQSDSSTGSHEPVHWLEFSCLFLMLLAIQIDPYFAERRAKKMAIRGNVQFML